MNYNSTQLNVLLFNLKDAITSNAIKVKTTNIVKEQVAAPVKINHEDEVTEKNEQPENLR